MAVKFEIYKDESGKFRWKLTSEDRIIIAKSSESYLTKGDAVNDLWSTLADTHIG